MPSCFSCLLISGLKVSLKQDKVGITQYKHVKISLGEREIKCFLHERQVFPDDTCKLPAWGVKVRTSAGDTWTQAQKVGTHSRLVRGHLAQITGDSGAPSLMLFTPLSFFFRKTL